jgi:Spy/CpxP family protein refolding chaperone
MKTLPRFVIASVLAAAGLGQSLLAADAPAPVTPKNPATVAIADKRADGIMKALNITDASKATAVKQNVANFVITVKNVYDGDPKTISDAQKAELVKARDTLYASFAADKLDEKQIETIKNGLAANRIKIEYDAFLDLIPKLTDEQKTWLKAQLLECADEAVLLNSGEEKLALFMNRRGRINNYLSKQGYDLKALSKERNARSQNN